MSFKDSKLITVLEKQHKQQRDAAKLLGFTNHGMVNGGNVIRTRYMRDIKCLLLMIFFYKVRHENGGVCY